ncbi:hypothetical protein IWX49DRAFT_215350 [Phyllosticta citricarpa]
MLTRPQSAPCWPLVFAIQSPTRVPSLISPVHGNPRLQRATWSMPRETTTSQAWRWEVVLIRVQPRPRFNIYALSPISTWSRRLDCESTHLLTPRASRCASHARGRLKRGWEGFREVLEVESSVLKTMREYHVPCQTIKVFGCRFFRISNYVSWSPTERV